MFRKIVSNLAFSPALVGQLGFYARRLKKEEATRRLGLVFTALALIVQSLTVFTPPESANAANPSDFIYGGVKTKRDLLAAYDNRRSDFKDIMDYAGITRAELANMRDSNINSRGKGTGAGSWKTWGRVKRFSQAQTHIVPLDTGGSSTVYSRALWWYDSTSYTIPNGSTYDAFVGHSAKRGAFAIMKDCGNLVTTTTPKPDVGAHFIAASCEMIRGKAIDERDKDARIKVLLYFGGPPGKGEKSAPILTNASNNTFSFQVPEEYKKRPVSTKVWGVMVPLAGWHDSTVQFETPVSIPGGCIAPPQTPQTSQTQVCDLVTRSAITITETAFDPARHSRSLSDCATPCADNSPACIQVTESKTSTNLTQGVEATTIKAQASDRIEYTVHIENIGQLPVSRTISEELSDVLEYAKLTQPGGGTFDETGKVLSWGDVTLQPGEKTSRSFVVQMLDTIPTTARGSSEPSSYDCIMTNAFGNTVNIPVACEAPKMVESATQELPKTGPGENLLFAGVVGSIVTFFWARSRQLGREVKLIRKDFNMGTI